MDKLMDAFQSTHSFLLFHIDPSSNWLLILMVIAAVCGAIIGVDREKRESAAGFRTLTLIALGSCCYTIGSVLLSEGRGDPARIAAQVVTGIGFIGGGAIFKSEDTVKGVTTAASMWVVCVIGMLIGAGYPILGFFVTLISHVILRVRMMVAKMIFGECRLSGWKIFFDPKGGKAKLFLLELLEEFDVEEFSFVEEEGKNALVISYCTIHTFHRGFMSKVAREPYVTVLEERK